MNQSNPTPTFISDLSEIHFLYQPPIYAKTPNVAFSLGVSSPSYSPCFNLALNLEVIDTSGKVDWIRNGLTVYVFYIVISPYSIYFSLIWNQLKFQWKIMEHKIDWNNNVCARAAFSGRKQESSIPNLSKAGYRIHILWSVWKQR